MNLPKALGNQPKPATIIVYTKENDGWILIKQETVKRTETAWTVSLDKPVATKIYVWNVNQIGQTIP